MSSRLSISVSSALGEAAERAGEDSGERWGDARAPAREDMVADEEGKCGGGPHWHWHWHWERATDGCTRRLCHVGPLSALTVQLILPTVVYGSTAD